MRSYVAVLALVAGCDLYLPHGPEDDVCEPGGVLIGQRDLRDPDTGSCQSFPTAVECGCNELCDPPGAPDWGACESSCSGLDEAACLVRPGCQAAFLLPISEPAGLPPITPAFTGCWATPTPAIEGGACDGLAAAACSRRDDCGAVYIGPTGSQEFAQCIAEPDQACDTLTTEGDCKLHADCTPVYAGMDCTCTPTECTCATETYERCESAPAP